MPVITIASTKGGVGKSTLAVNLSAQFAKQGNDVALLDADPQGSAFKWSTVRQAVIDEGAELPNIFVASVQGQALLDLSQEKSNQGCYVFIDSAGVDNQSTRSALVRSDYVLMVAAPSTMDLWEVGTLLKAIDALGKVQKRTVPVFLLFNKASTHRNVKSVDDARAFLQESLIFPTHTLKTVIKDRIVYQHAIRDGKGVVEYKPLNRDACREMRKLQDELMAVIRQFPTKEVT